MARKREATVPPQKRQGPSDDDRGKLMDLNQLPMDIHKGYDGEKECEYVAKISDTEIHVVFKDHRDIWKFKDLNWVKQ